jgi:hypothetical protein
MAKNALNLQDMSTGNSPKERQSAAEDMTGDTGYLGATISEMGYGCAKIVGNKDGSEKSDGLGGSK